VELYSTSGNRITATTTNAAGVYNLTQVGGGTYLLLFNAQYAGDALLND
jgi:hypothetical protein